jgi:hypothetical protein
MKEIIVQNLKTLRRGQTKGHEDEVVFLHLLLNYHLGPPSDQLPVAGPGATDFGPRTEAKVKEFQEVNKIDIGTPFFKDGVVGKHTWAALTEPFLMKVVIFPKLTLTPPTFPNFQFPLPPKPPLIPVPKLTFPPISMQSGVQITKLFDAARPSEAHSLQVTAILLKKKDGVVREGQAGLTIVDTPGDATDKTDVGFIGVLSTGDLPWSTESVAWSIQGQMALLKSLTDRAASGQANALLDVDVTVFKKADVATIKLTGQGGLILEVDTPGRDNTDHLVVRAGGAAFLGLTVIFGQHEDPKK